MIQLYKSKLVLQILITVNRQIYYQADRFFFMKGTVNRADFKNLVFRILKKKKYRVRALIADKQDISKLTDESGIHLSSLWKKNHKLKNKNY